MHPIKKERLEANGWKVGTVDDFLGLTKEEAALVEHRLKRGRFIEQEKSARERAMAICRILHAHINFAK